MIHAVTELPVNCPDYNGMVMTYEADSMTGNHTFEEPSFGPSNVTVLSGIMYYEHGEYMVEFSITDGERLPVGTYTLITTISDDELSRDCLSTINVTGWWTI